VRFAAPLFAIGLAAVAVGCGGSGKSSSSGSAASTSGGSTSVKLTSGSNLTIAVITHGAGDSFWSVAKKGAEQAAKDLGVKLIYQESNNDPQKQAQEIEAVVAQHVDGLAVTAPNPDAIKDALQKAEAAGIPVITLNSGEQESKALGAITHVGQDEGVAGQGAGAKLAAAGAKKLLCIIHEQSNIGLQQRCDGAKKGFTGGTVENLQVTGVSDISKTQSEIQAKLQSEKDIDAVLSLNPDVAIAARDAAKAAGSSAKIATFDLSKDVISSIQDGSVLFAVDQQQYLQGYLPVVFLYLYKTNADTVGGGLPVLTGPGFVEKSNAATVAQLAAQGTR
jgi:simple sugar transport system substrate-binding protein